jgi:hypothetical protein
MRTKILWNTQENASKILTLYLMFALIMAAITFGIPFSSKILPESFVTDSRIEGRAMTSAFYKTRFVKSCSVE